MWQVVERFRKYLASSSSCISTTILAFFFCSSDRLILKSSSSCNLWASSCMCRKSKKITTGKLSFARSHSITKRCLPVRNRNVIYQFYDKTMMRSNNNNNRSNKINLIRHLTQTRLIFGGDLHATKALGKVAVCLRPPFFCNKMAYLRWTQSKTGNVF